MTIKEVKRGELFTLKEVEYPTDRQVYVRGEYDRCERGQNSPRFFVSGSRTILAEKPKHVFVKHVFVKLHNGRKRHGKRRECIRIAYYAII